MSEFQPLVHVLKVNDSWDVERAIEITKCNSFNSVIMKLTCDLYTREYRDDEVAANHRAFTGSPLAFPASTYYNLVIPLIEINSDLDNEDEEIRLNYERKIINDVNYAAYVRPNGPIYIKPSTSCKPFHLGKFLQQILPTSSYEPSFVVEIDMTHKEYFKQMHFKDEDQEEIPSTWAYWNKIHEASGFSNRIEVALVLSSDSLDDENEVTRWLGECISMIVLPNDCFHSNSNNYPVLAQYIQNVTRLFMQCCRPAIVVEPDHFEDKTLCHYKDYMKFQENSFVSYDAHSVEQDFPRYPLQPLRDNLESCVYETFESDNAKYILYQRAIEAALKDMITDEEKSTKEVVIMVVGAGQGPLVRSALNASKNTERKVKIVIVEKNPNAVNVLEQMVRDLWTNENIELIFSDMRKTEYQQNVDILVSELLGSFGDNELSPECLDGIQHYLKPTGISIPCDSISYIRPITSKRANSTIVKCYGKKLEAKGHSSLEASWLIYLSSVYYIDDTKEVFKFEHPNRDDPIDNSRHKVVEFKTQVECVLSGFAGYFSAKLYKDIEISIHPDSHTQAMRSWYSIYFPLPEPVTLEKNDRIEVAFWRKCDEKKVWYEYQLIAPKENDVVNQDGKVHPIFL